MNVLNAPTPHDEAARLRTLRALDVLDTPPDPRFDRYTRMAQRLLDVPIALISLVDRDRAWFKSGQGHDVAELPRSVAFCAHAILNDDPLIVPDASLDPRFAANPMVTGKAGLSFYAGFPLLVSGGSAIGTLCVYDREPRHLDPTQIQMLRELATIVNEEMSALKNVTVDAVTGLPNRKGFDAVASQALAVNLRIGRPVTLVVVEVEEPRSWAEGDGAEEHDERIQETGELLLHTFRESDVFGRIGDNLFGVLLAGATEVEARSCLQRLQQQLSSRNAVAGSRQRVSVSAGLTEFGGVFRQDVGELVDAATRALRSPQHVGSVDML